EARELRVVDRNGREAGLRERRLERGCVLGALAQLGNGSGQEDLAVAALDVEQGEHVVGPRRRGQELADGEARLEWSGLGAEPQPRRRLAFDLVQPARREVPLA